MLYGLHPTTRVLWDVEDALAVSVEFPRSLCCPDPTCTSGLVLRNGRSRCAHLAHKPNTPRCGGAAMTEMHKTMQRTLGTLSIWSSADAEVTVAVPEHPLRTLATRRADVSVRLRQWDQELTVTVECQHSATNLEREERRVLDHNVAGFPVLMVASSRCVRDAGGGRAVLDPWLFDWVERHGRRQVAVVDEGGRLWWCWFEKKARTNPVLTERVELVPGGHSTCGRWKLGLTVDATSPNPSTGAPSLLIAAFSWVARSRASVGWPDHPVTRPAGTRRPAAPAFQAERLARPYYLGRPGAKAMFGRELVHGGF